VWREKNIEEIKRRVKIKRAARTPEKIKKDYAARRKWIEANSESIARKEKEYREKNAERIKKRQIEYRKNNVEILRARARAYYQKNKAKISAKRKMNRLLGISTENDRLRKWRKDNPEKLRRQNNSEQSRLRKRNHIHRRRERIRKTSDVTNEHLSLLKASAKISGRCPICNQVVDGEKRKWWIEHAIPLSRGGTHTADNIFYDCHLCNMMKKHQTLKEFIGFTLQELVKKWAERNYEPKDFRGQLKL
jgi:hypothetical protein